MTAQIHDIADQRPHLCMEASDRVHVIPVALVRSIIKDEKPSSVLTEPVLCRVLEEWLYRTVVSCHMSG